MDRTIDIGDILLFAIFCLETFEEVLKTLLVNFQIQDELVQSFILFFKTGNADPEISILDVVNGNIAYVTEEMDHNRVLQQAWCSSPELNASLVWSGRVAQVVADLR